MEVGKFLTSMAFQTDFQNTKSAVAHLFRACEETA